MTKVKCNEKECEHNNKGVCSLRDITLNDSNCQSYNYTG